MPNCSLHIIRPTFIYSTLSVSTSGELLLKLACCTRPYMAGRLLAVRAVARDIKDRNSSSCSSSTWRCNQWRSWEFVRYPRAPKDCSHQLPRWENPATISLQQGSVQVYVHRTYRPARVKQRCNYAHSQLRCMPRLVGSLNLKQEGLGSAIWRLWVFLTMRTMISGRSYSWQSLLLLFIPGLAQSGQPILRLHSLHLAANKAST